MFAWLVYGFACLFSGNPCHVSGLAYMFWFLAPLIVLISLSSQHPCEQLSYLMFNLDSCIATRTVWAIQSTNAWYELHPSVEMLRWPAMSAACQNHPGWGAPKHTALMRQDTNLADRGSGSTCSYYIAWWLDFTLLFSALPLKPLCIMRPMSFQGMSYVLWWCQLCDRDYRRADEWSRGLERSLIKWKA